MTLPSEVILLREKGAGSSQDNSQMLKFACDDLRSIQPIILTVTDHPEYANVYETLGVIDRALMSIINGI